MPEVPQDLVAVAVVLHHLKVQLELVVDMVVLELLSSHTQPDKYLKT
tara:strand:+ start:377 stop:517 length:141 start_codon:yes stop_codon:yes gene_type:complete